LKTEGFTSVDNIHWSKNQLKLFYLNLHWISQIFLRRVLD